MTLFSGHRLWIAQANRSRPNARNMNSPDPAFPSAAPPAKGAPLKPTGAHHCVLLFS
jgi:hypothetical protein